MAARRRQSGRGCLYCSDPILWVSEDGKAEKIERGQTRAVCVCVYARGVVCRAQALGNLVLNGGKVSVWECGVEM